MKNLLLLKWSVRNQDDILKRCNIVFKKAFLKFQFLAESLLETKTKKMQLPLLRVIVLFFFLSSNFITSQINFTNSQAASLVVGQANFTANVANCTQSGMYAPSYTAISSKGVLAVSEQTGGRVKLWNPTPTANGANASVVVGKTGFTDCSNAGTNQASVSNSNGVAFSPDGNKLIVTDFGANRVLIWNTIPTVNGQNADVVLGQPNFTTGTSGVSATAMNGPTGAFVSNDGRLIIADRGNHRILIWNSIPTTNNRPADVVVGQTVFNVPGGGTSATTMVNPWGVCVSPDGKLLVADSANNRILVWNTIPTTNGAAADVVIGQPSLVNNGAGTTASNLNAPIGVTVSPSGKVAIGEFGNSRVIIYNAIPTVNGAAANVVLGQPSFTSSTAFYPSGSPTNNNMFSVYNASFDLYGRLYVAGREMNRVLVFGTAPAVQANLGIAISSNISNACLGASNILTITLTNTSANAATGVIASASLPAGFTYSSHTASSGSYNNTTGTWTVGTVPANGTLTLTINGIANASGSLAAYASIVQSNQLDPVLANNGASVSYSIVGQVFPPSGSANQTFCNAATISNLVATGTNIQWYADATLGSPLSTSLALVDGVTYYASQTIAPCESATRLAVTVAIQPLITYFEDADTDGFGNPSVTITSCVPVAGYVLDNTDCNDAQLQYADLDSDGFGSTTLVACGVANNSDSDDNLLTYLDNDGDTFGSTTLAPSGVTNNSDCDDAQLQYADADGDGFGSATLVACGVANNSDSDDNLLTYLDNDGDTFGSTTLAPSGVTNNSDCDDTQLQYADADGDGFGSATLVACGVNNNSDSDDNLLTYLDNDGDTFGSTTLVPSGVTNNSDCNDNEVRYLDADNDGFGVTTMVACGGSLFSTDCDDAIASINPGVIDICGDGIDNDCNGVIDNVGQPGGCVPVLATLPLATCGSTITNLAVTINATYIVGAQGYRFRIRNLVTNFVHPLVDRPVNSFALSSIPGITLGTAYEIDVALRLNNVWQPFYGSPCIVNTPSPLATIGAQCGSTVASMGTFVYANYTSSVTAYRFRITNLTTNGVQVFDPVAGQNKFNFNQLTAAMRAFGTTYSVEVALRNTDGNYLPYGTACTISTPAFPTSEIILSQCDSVASSNIQNFNAVTIPGATNYRFQLSNATLGYSFSIDRPVNTYNLSMFPGLVAGTTYTVRVAVRIEGIWGPLTGKPCNITTPGVVPGGERVVVANNDFVTITYPNPFAESFMFDVITTNESTIQVRVYDMLGKQIENRNVDAAEINNIQIGSNYPSGVYNVIVSQGENTQTLRVIKR